MSAAKPGRALPCWRGMLTRQRYGSGGDIGRVYCSTLAANAADEIIMGHQEKMTPSEIPGCWAAAFRGALRRLNETAWHLQLTYRRRETRN